MFRNACPTPRKAREEGRSVGHFDVHDYIAMAKVHYEEVGLGAAYIEKLFR